MQRNCRKKSSRANYYTGKKLLSWEDEGSLVSSSSLCQKVLQERDFLLPLLWPFLPAWRRWWGVRDRSHLLLWIPSQSIYRTKFIHKKSSDSGSIASAWDCEEEAREELREEEGRTSARKKRRQGERSRERSRRKRAHNLCETLLSYQLFLSASLAALKPIFVILYLFSLPKVTSFSRLRFDRIERRISNDRHIMKCISRLHHDNHLWLSLFEESQVENRFFQFWTRKKQLSFLFKVWERERNQDECSVKDNDT